MTHPPSQVFREALVDRRKHLGLDQKDVVERLDRIAGYPMDRTTYLRLERGERKITLDDACALSVVLSVPLSVMLSPIDGDRSEVPVAAGLPVSPWRAWEWYRGEEPLDITPTEEWRPVADRRQDYNEIRLARNDAFRTQARYRMTVRDGGDIAKDREDYLRALQDFAEGLLHLRDLGIPYRDLLPTDEAFLADLSDFTDWTDED